MSEKWTAADIPDQTGRTAVITGGNSGLGLAAAEALAGAGATVVIACRDATKGNAAAERIAAAAKGAAASGPKSAAGDATVEVEELDLASLASVRACAERLLARPGGIDLLINNAGVMAAPRRHTADGFELQFGTNHLGHFALVGQLLPALRGREDARVVTVSSNAHKFGRIAFDNLGGAHRYFRWRAYGQSKLANLLFARELDRRLRAAGWEVKSLAAHPGYAKTNLQSSGPPRLDTLLMAVPDLLIAQSPEMGTLPELYAATRANLDGGLYIGPDGFEEQRGHPKVVAPSRQGRDEVTAKRLWDVSEEMTGVSYDFNAA
jgi:NAD(P)-dependent dehydrogenase (short-subunit alcohol dehydrogenase family)